MKKITKSCFLTACFIFASFTFAEDILISRSVTNIHGERYRADYKVTVEKAAEFPTDPLEGGIPLSFEDALDIALESIAEKGESGKIQLSGGGLNFSSARPRFYYWSFRFVQISKDEKVRDYLTAIVLLDGSIVEPTVEKLP
jgi:hypothetical protein